jgi:copper(I)-binding protein
VSVASAWLRGVPPGQSNSAAYMLLTNNSAKDRRLVAVTTPQARAVEIHESTQVEGMWRMRRLADIVIPARSTYELQPGGAHLMVFGLAQTPLDGDTIWFSLQFDNDEELKVAAPVRAPGQLAH